MKTMAKSAKKVFAAAACISMLLVCFAGCNQLAGGGAKADGTEKILRKTVVRVLL